MTTNAAPTTELPLIISVDDHLVEPPDVWSSRLPERYREIGPRMVAGVGPASQCGLPRRPGAPPSARSIGSALSPRPAMASSGLSPAARLRCSAT